MTYGNLGLRLPPTHAAQPNGEADHGESSQDDGVALETAVARKHAIEGIGRVGVGREVRQSLKPIGQTGDRKVDGRQQDDEDARDLGHGVAHLQARRPGANDESDSRQGDGREDGHRQEPEAELDTDAKQGRTQEHYPAIDDGVDNRGKDHASSI
jgi:hypothetical protein